MNNTNTNNEKAAVKLADLLNIPALDVMPEQVKTAAAAEKQAAEVVKTAAAAAEKAQKDVAAAITAGDIAAAQKALSEHKTAAAKLDKARDAHKTATAKLDKVKEVNPYKAPTAAEYCIAAAVALFDKGIVMTAANVAETAISLMPEADRPKTANGTEMTARGVIATLRCLRVAEIALEK